MILTVKDLLSERAIECLKRFSEFRYLVKTPNGNITFYKYEPAFDFGVWWFTGKGKNLFCETNIYTNEFPFLVDNKLYDIRKIVKEIEKGEK